MKPPNLKHLSNLRSQSHYSVEVSVQDGFLAQN